MLIPANLEHLRAKESGRAWLDRLPELVAECVESWQLRLGATLPGGSVSLPIEATMADGTDTVLKMQWPHRESDTEAAALALWGGAGAIRLLAADDTRHALLLERCRPGTALSAEPSDVVLGVMAELLPRLWKPAAGPFRSLADEASWWASHLERDWERAGKPYARVLLDATLDGIKTLSGSQGEQVLLHQDLHPGNVLRAEREPWLVIDPKPLAGEREFGIAAIVRAFELEHSREQTLRRLDRLSSDLGLDRERARQWALVQAIAWLPYDDPRRLIETATWLHEAARR